MNILQADLLGNTVGKIPKNILLILGTISVFTNNLLAKDMWNIEQKNYDPEILIDNVRGNWELWDEFHRFNDWKFWNDEKKLVTEYLQNVNNFSKYQKWLLNKEINGDFQIKLTEQLRKSWRNFSDLAKSLKIKWYYHWNVKNNFSKELLKALIEFKNKNNLEAWLLWPKTIEKLFAEKYIKIIAEIEKRENIPNWVLLILIRHENPYFNSKSLV